MAEASGAPPRPRLMLAPPPVLFALTFVAAFTLDRLVPLPRSSTDVGEALRIGGWVMFALGLAVMFGGLATFGRARTTIVPHGRASALVTTGIYSVTRNPMYVGLTVAYVGLAAQQRLLWALPFLALPLAALVRVIVPFEETRLRGLFGDAYTTYCARVRRWL